MESMYCNVECPAFRKIRHQRRGPSFQRRRYRNSSLLHSNVTLSLGPFFFHYLLLLALLFYRTYTAATRGPKKVTVTLKKGPKINIWYSMVLMKGLAATAAAGQIVVEAATTIIIIIIIMSTGAGTDDRTPQQRQNHTPVFLSEPPVCSRLTPAAAPHELPCKRAPSGAQACRWLCCRQRACARCKFNIDPSLFLSCLICSKLSELQSTCCLCPPPPEHLITASPLSRSSKPTLPP